METRQIWRIKTVSEHVGAAPSTVYEWLREDKHADLNFPKPVKIGARASGWYSDEVMDWINSRPRV